MYQVPTRRRARPRDDRALGDREVAVGDDHRRVELHLHAEAGALLAGAVRAVEREVARLQLAEGEAVVRAGEVLGVDALLVLELRLLVLHQHERRSMPPPSRSAVSTESVTRIRRESFSAVFVAVRRRFGDEAVDDDVDRVALVLVEL